MTLRWPRLSPPAVWPCGHPRNIATEQSVGGGRVQCRLCRRAIARESYRRCFRPKKPPKPLPAPGERR